MLTGAAVTSELLQSFQIDFLDVLQALLSLQKLLHAACTESLGLTRKSNLGEDPKQNRFTTMPVQSQDWPDMKCQAT